MYRPSLVAGLAVAVLATAAGAQQPGATMRQGLTTQSDAERLLSECRARQVERWAGVTHYAVDQSMMGNRVAVAYERFDAPGPDGTLYPAFRPLTTNGPVDSEMAKAYAQGAKRLGDGLHDEMTKSGLPVGILDVPGQDPWASTDPRVMMGGASTFVTAAADAQAANERERKAAVAGASESMGHMAEVAARMRLVGAGTVEGRSARHLQARGLQRRLTSQGDGQMVIDDVDLWIDTRECVPLKMTMAGTMTAQGQTRSMTIERIDADYRNVPGSRMYAPFRQVMRMKGVMTPEQEREMAKAQAQLADMEKRLAQLPPGQRDMIMRQMGPQMATMKSMATGGGIEVTIEVHSILVNPDSAALQKLQASAAGMGGLSGLPGVPGGGAGFPTTPPTAPAPNPAPAAAAGQAATTQTAEKACLEQKIGEKQEAQKKKQGMGRLLGAVGRVAGQFGVTGMSQAVNDAYAAKATANDLTAAARDLGITEDEIAACSGVQ